MLIFFGLGGSKLRQRKISGNTSCPNCKSENSFIAATFGRYFHIFWIPIFPLYRENIIECSICKESYNEDELPKEIKEALASEAASNPVKRPSWHYFGCFITLISVLGFVLLTVIVGLSNNMGKKENPNKHEKDFKKETTMVTSNPSNEDDPLSYFLKSCLDLPFEEVDADLIKYRTIRNQGKLLILLKVMDLRNLRTSSRKEIVTSLETCLSEKNLNQRERLYIGVMDSQWNMVMVKTPTESKLKGESAEAALLYPFFN